MRAAVGRGMDAVARRAARVESLCRLEPWLVGLIAAHTVAIGAGLLFLTPWATRFGGWEGVDPAFFPRQGGAFHFVVAIGYLLEYRRGSVALLVATKTIACIFLLGVGMVEPVPWSVPASGVIDGLMGAAVVVVRRLTSRPLVIHPLTACSPAGHPAAPSLHADGARAGGSTPGAGRTPR